MPAEYTPSGSSRAYTVPAYTDTVDGPTSFKSFADDVDDYFDAAAADLAALESDTGNLKYLVTNAQSGSYALVLSDAGKLIEMSGGGTLTVPLDSSVAFPVGTQITVLQTGSSQVTIAPQSTVTINSAGGYLKIAAQWSAVTLIKRGTDTWVALGALVA